MKLIKPSFEIIEQKPSMQGLYEQIELAARCCYKSEGLIKYDEEGNSTTAKEFVDKIVNVYKHQSVAEHGTVYLKVPIKIATEEERRHINNYMNHHWVEWIVAGHFEFITSNYRWIVENHLETFLDFICEPTEFHKKRVTVRFITDRGISHELVRHRKFSFSQESTRYCNYSSNKFGNELTFIIPSWQLIVTGRAELGILSHPGDYFEDSLMKAEKTYFKLLELGWFPQQARQVLPNALKTEVIMTGFISDWKHFFELRDSTKAHPDMVALAKPLHEEFIKRGYLK